MSSKFGFKDFLTNLKDVNYMFETQFMIPAQACYA